MIFARPDYLYLLFAVPLLALLKLWADRHRGRVLDAFTSPRLRDTLVSGASTGRSWLIFGLQLLALGGFILALCGPRWGEEKTQQLESGRNIIIAIDTSRSMLANDVTPDRLTRAKLAAQDLLLVLKTDRVGLIAFSGQPYLQAPLTTDHDAVIETIQSLDHTSVPRGGSELGRAINLAMETFAKSPARNHGLIIFSDGGEPDSEVSAMAKQAAQKNILILTVGVGTEAGSLIPDPDPDKAGDYIRDREGNVVKTRLEGTVLQEIANATHGRYLKLGSQPLAAAVVRDLLLSLQAQTNAAKELVKPIERFHWPLSMGMVLLMIAWLIRPSSRPRSAQPVLAALVALCLPMPSVMAASPEDATVAWNGGPTRSAGFPASSLPSASSSNAQARMPVLLAAFFSNGRKVNPHEAHEAFQRGDYKKAKDLYNDLVKQTDAEKPKREFAYALGATAHQLKDYDRAVGAFTEALESTDQAVQKRAHRGLGHSLYDQGDRALAKQPKFTLKAWRDSLRHFDGALRIDPNDKETQENRDFVKKRLDELQKQMDAQEQQQKGKKGDKGDKGKKGEKGQKGDKGENGEEGEDENGEAGDQKPDGKSGKGDEDKPKESLAKDKGDKEGKGEEQLPEGQIQAGKEGDKKDEEGEEAGQSEMAENDRNDATGYSRNEARAFLRTYADDQKGVQLRRERDNPVKGKDW